ncbi:MAG TPA: hypothetical protein VIE68_07855 [Gemmatimonadota bacterium]
MIAVGVAALLAGGILACQGETSEEDTPIVVEEGGPIALGESLPSEPTEAEIQLAEEPRVVTRTVVVRERPEPARETAMAPEDREPVAPARVSTIPAGTAVPITLLAQVDSEHNEVGQSWTGRVTRDVVVGGQVVIPAGAAVSGVVVAMDEGDSNEGNGSITLEARSIETTSGTRSIASAPVSGGHSYADQGFPAKETAIGAGAGAAIGAIVGGKKGAAIGAAAGGMGGAAMGSARADYEVAMPAGTDLTIRITSAVAL